MTWTFDAPSGTYKDNALSQAIRREALAEVQCMKFVDAEPGFGSGKGQSITITRFLQLPLASRVNEFDRLPSGRPAIQVKSVTVGEWGFKIETTEFEKDLTTFDIMNQFQRMLRDQMSITMDKMCADAMKLTPLKYQPKVSGGVLDTGGSPSVTSDKNLDVSDLRRVHDELRKLKVPYFRGGNFVGILSTRAARGIKNDPEYKDWLAPTTAMPFITGQLKDVEGFTLVETNAADSFVDLVGTSVTTGEAIFFGADQAFLAVVNNPELRAGLPEDLGRFREVGWVGALEAGLTWDQAAQARIIHVTST
jgi:N4-gp56 family major capsid protein